MACALSVDILRTRGEIVQLLLVATQGSGEGVEEKSRPLLADGAWWVITIFRTLGVPGGGLLGCRDMASYESCYCS